MTTRKNPFFVLLLVVSTLFVITVMGYLVGPFVEARLVEHDGAGPSAGSRALASWFDRKGVQALAIEFGLMVVLSILAILAERPSSARKAD